MSLPDRLKSHIRLLWLGIGFAAALLGCADIESAAHLGATDSQARDQLMIVDAKAANWGYQRLQALCRGYAALGDFTLVHGAPDYLYEGPAPGTAGRAIVLFYLKPQKAYAFRRTTLANSNVTPAGEARINPQHFDHLSIIQQIFAQSSSSPSQ